MEVHLYTPPRARNNGRSTDNAWPQMFAELFIIKLFIYRFFNRISVGIEISILSSTFHKVVTISVRRRKVHNNALILTYHGGQIFVLLLVTTLNRYIFSRTCTCTINT
jgi:hypothetical protein